MRLSLDYDGLVYSHIVYDKPTSTGFFKHAHTMYEILFFIDGDADYMVENRKYELKKGDILLIHPMNYHYLVLRSDRPYERIVINFEEHIADFDKLGLLFDETDLIRTNAAFFTDWYERVDSFARSLPDEDLKKLITHMLVELLYLVQSHRNETEPVPEIGVSPLVNKALKLIDENLAGEISVEHLATELFVSKSHLQHTFTQEMGISPKRYAQNKRLLRAQNLLRTGEKATRIFDKVGYTDYSSFYRAYKKLFGVSPDVTSINRKP